MQKATLEQGLGSVELRSMPWRPPELGLVDGRLDPYKVLVSEMMLQQTQVARVAPKYREFIARYDSFSALAAASQVEVLRLWQGLGYNRRAKYLLEAAKELAKLADSPTLEQLMALNGVGYNTAAAIRVYSLNEPLVFIETNIRTVVGHYFFLDRQDQVADSEIQKIMESIVPSEDPRTWYYKMMDHGAILKKSPSSKSMNSFKSYSKQSAFEGSRRQLRGQCLRLLLEEPRDIGSLVDMTGDKDRTESVVLELQKEGLLAKDKDLWRVAG